ncbi:MAG: vitamin K epoxide reductase family protein [Actinobacteria bacterium]|nr:vitamin K epoxide reductase family protein [Actinomycetota bacterium]
MNDEATPKGWSYNPSSWPQRLPIVGLALIGTAVAAYLAAYQLRWIDTVWEPFFGNGSIRILNSKVSHILPIPDAALGAAGYFLDAVTGLIGSRDRWRSLPWMVVLFGIAVGPLGAISVLLVILQPVMFDAFCTLCLASAVISVLMIGPAMDEVLASLQYVKGEAARGSWWRAFWGMQQNKSRKGALTR